MIYSLWKHKAELLLGQYSCVYWRILKKGNEIKARQTFTERTTSATFRRIHEGFFSKKEIEEMIEGKDFWLDEHEVRERWSRKTSTVPRIVDELPASEPTTKRGRPRKA